MHNKVIVSTVCAWHQVYNLQLGIYYTDVALKEADKKSHTAGHISLESNTAYDSSSNVFATYL